MAYASANYYVALTHDPYFNAILAAPHGDKPRVVRIRSEELNPDAIAKQIIACLAPNENRADRRRLAHH
ncbi:hypothetical protein [Thiobacillus sp. 65-1402]|uniref:hypothetical protein n=1 Tax=Thiobacillus sp. 65-1402 TaxID=1895861 RepID=UPI0025D76E73|nr:hypothetical protein [Thiobacillus sp. 65-1402]